MPYLSLDGRDGHRIHTYRLWNPTLQFTVIGPSIGPSQGKSESFSEFGICTLEEIYAGYLLRIPSGQHCACLRLAEGVFSATGRKPA